MATAALSSDVDMASSTCEHVRGSYVHESGSLKGCAECGEDTSEGVNCESKEEVGHGVCCSCLTGWSLSVLIHTVY